MPLGSLSERLTKCDRWAEIDDYVTAKLKVCPMGNVHQTPFLFVWDQICHSREHTHLSHKNTVIFMLSFRQSLLSKSDGKFPYL